MRRSRRKTVITILVMAGLLLWAVFPFYWMLVTSIKTNDEIYGPVAAIIPTTFTTQHWRELFTRTAFVVQFRNSLIISGSTTLLSMAIGSLGAYAVARLQFAGRTIAARSLIYSYLVPPAVLFIPLFQLMSSLGLLNSLQGLIISYLTFTVPFCTWLLVGYFKTVPVELEEAALVDGCNRLTTLVRITLPLSAPALVVVALFSFTLSWNEFLYALVFNQDANTRPVTAGLTAMAVEDVFFWGRMMAAAALGSLPPIILYTAAQRYVVRGLTLGAVKG
ncbi:MAG: carbohydrate ABC transporter permease [Chloroflexi bacterium]|nr:carbohydrate ABC transporter permease [Chloroflexota bacterium]MCL5109530.1 carbohydrate ABC transporter permease [Chloroflexota bacterium]